MGPKGSGKTLNGHTLAKKFGVFHVDFKERLQELILSKTKKKIGPAYEEEIDEEVEESNKEEEEYNDNKENQKEGRKEHKECFCIFFLLGIRIRTRCCMFWGRSSKVTQ